MTNPGDGKDIVPTVPSGPSNESGDHIGDGITKGFIEAKTREMQEEGASLEKQKGENKDLTSQLKTRVAGSNSELDPTETERYLNDVFIREQKEKIRRMEDAIKVLTSRQQIVGENGEISQRKFGDMIWGYTISFPADDGTVVEEKLNIMLVPSALVGDGEFKAEVKGEEIKVTVVSPSSEIGKRIVNASI